MSAELDSKSRDILHDTNFAQVATLRKDGTVHVLPVWVDEQDGHVVLNTAEGRAWYRNIERDPRVSLNVQNLKNPYEYLEVRGQVTERTREGADEHIDAMAKKYLDQDTYPYRQAGEQRVIVRISPEWVKVGGG
jgi:PPOX class probable F420-dependent enzyme